MHSPSRIWRRVSRYKCRAQNWRRRFANSMGKIQSSLDDATRTFMEAQHMFFVASAPIDVNGHINVSPKGMDSFRILSPTTIVYLDLTGSGVETIAHIKENGR